MASSRAHRIQSEDFQPAIAKAVELRSLHAALLQRSNLGSPAVLGPQVGASPPVSRRSNPLPSAEDYPVFTPSYEEEPLRGNHYLRPEHRSLSETWRAIKFLGEGKNDEAVNLGRSEHSTPCSERNILFRNEHFSKRSSSCTNHLVPVQSSPLADPRNSSSSRTSPGFETITTCNSCKPATINRESEDEHKNSKTTAASVASLHDSEPPIHGHTKHRGQLLSWLFPKSKKKPKQEETSPNLQESEDDMSHMVKDWGLLSVESMKRELLEANRERDAALAEVSEMRSSLGDLNQKLVKLETYCEELKKALKRPKHARNSESLNRPSLSFNRTNSHGNNGSINNISPMPVTNDVMMEGFLQIVSESRLCIKQFCKMLMHYIKEADCDLMEKLDLLIQPRQMDVTSNRSRVPLYHVEALINRCLYQDFENCVFMKDGSPKFLDPQQGRRDKFSSFIALRNLSWYEVLRKGTKFYSEEFSRFCDQKMSCIGSFLNWSRPWPEQLLQCLFVAAKCIWLLHLLAYSFSPPLTIMRVVEGQKFDPRYMDDIVLDRNRTERPPVGVKVMVTPGFYIEDRIIKCRVLCR